MKLSFKMEKTVKVLSEKVKLKEFIITKTLLYEMLKGLIEKKVIKNMNSKVTTNSQLSTTEPKKEKRKCKEKGIKEMTRTGTESQKGRSHGGLSVGKVRGEWGKRYRE